MPSTASRALLPFPLPPPCHKRANITSSCCLRIALALFVVATCCIAQETDAGWMDDAVVEEVLPLGDLSGGGGSDAGAESSGQIDGDNDTMMAWARARLKELQQQHGHQSSSLPPQTPTSSPQDLLSVLASHSDSFTSPEDIRNLFYSDAARAENQALQGDYTAAHNTCQNLLRVKPDFALCHHIMGSTLWRQQGRWAAAIRVLMR